MSTKEMTESAVKGYAGEPCTYLATSSLWYAHQVGVYFKTGGRPQPTDVRMSRGYSVRVRDMVFKHIEGSNFERIK